jgi:hypothetical protein
MRSEGGGREKRKGKIGKEKNGGTHGRRGI